MFDNVTCTGSNSSKTVLKVYTRDKLESCLNGTEVHAVTSSETGDIEQYCGKKKFPLSLSLSLFELYQDGITFNTIYNLIDLFIFLRGAYVSNHVSVRL